MREIIDISLPVSPKMVVWPGSPGFHIEKIQSIEKGDPVCSQQHRRTVCDGAARTAHERHRSAKSVVTSTFQYSTKYDSCVKSLKKIFFTELLRTITADLQYISEQ